MADAIIADRAANGTYADVFDFIERLGNSLGRKAIECLAYSGGFDSFGIQRKQFFLPCRSGNLFIDELARYATL